MTAHTFVNMEIYRATISAKSPVSSFASLGWMRAETDVEVQCESKEVAMQKFSKYARKRFPSKKGWTEHSIALIGDAPNHATNN